MTFETDSKRTQSHLIALAEGEELQTNLLQASQRIPARSGVLDEVFATHRSRTVASWNWFTSWAGGQRGKRAHPKDEVAPAHKTMLS